MRCFVLVQPQYAVNRALAAGRKTRPQGWTPRQLERAYRLPVNLRSHQTVAVSIAGRTPHLGSYLRTYRAHFGLPACGQPSGCLRIVNQKGKATPAAPSSLGSGWDVEATLDVSMISVACPHCKILVVEANSPSVSDLARADDTAARLGAQVISNSYGIRESGYSQTFARDYRHPGHMVVASSGDFGFDAANFPANLATVTAVGGTTLSRAHNARGFTERVWNDPSIFGAGSSGCSAYVRKPAWQHSPHCPGRTVADTSAVAADIPIYNKAWGGWLTVAGTSVAAPLTSGIYGLAGNGSAGHHPRPVPARGRLLRHHPGQQRAGRQPRSRPAATTTCAWPSEATTPPPAWAPPTASAASSRRAGPPRSPCKIKSLWASRW